jgi:hypothetical protein
MFEYILYGISALLLLWMSFRWSSDNFSNCLFKLLYLLSGLGQIAMILFKMGFIVKL